mgnify:CR=1 FL=1
MNCPSCRKKLWYEAMISVPNAKNPKDKQLAYYCSPCSTLYLFKQFDAKTAVRGVLVMRRGNLKRAGFSELKKVASSSRRGE